MSLIWVRRLIGLASGLSFGAVAAVLLLSDAVGPLANDAKAAIIKTGQQVERELQVDIVDRESIPGTFDQIGHALLWGVGMLVIGWLVRRSLPLPLTTLFVAGASLAFEVIGQPYLSDTRVVEPSDAVANLVGISAASVALGVVLVVSRIASTRSDTTQVF